MLTDFEPLDLICFLWPLVIKRQDCGFRPFWCEDRESEISETEEYSFSCVQRLPVLETEEVLFCA